MKKPKRININIDEKMRTNFKIACVRKGKDMTDVLINFIKSYIKKSGE